MLVSASVCVCVKVLYSFGCVLGHATVGPFPFGWQPYVDVKFMEIVIEAHPCPMPKPSSGAVALLLVPAPGSLMSP